MNTRRTSVLSLTAFALVAMAVPAQAAVLNFPDLLLVAGTHGTQYTTSTTSNLGTLSNSAVLSFDLTTGGATWISDLDVTITDPTGSTFYSLLPGAPDTSGSYSGTINFGSANPGSGLYSIGFTNTFGTVSNVNLTNIKLTVDAVPEPASMAALGFGALALIRRRRKA